MSRAYVPVPLPRDRDSDATVRTVSATAELTPVDAAADPIGRLHSASANRRSRDILQMDDVRNLRLL
ncbi:hypothetical protein ATY41_11850 [Leifsonia xyli subsp. xyli]|uniref:Uncharacterized protein n=2 Tax=Leifsonia xyli subsp. xyli TaxID=59736 RepID=Q6AGE9_LEIXX|nr:hypothetical protein [Leifsonia xyli]AAT88546.1 hypothetical protein Lxx05840 [Leifsonia xyli subsp. xyli str. CTCB07]ODA89901.1 hypothetical protein ATY41_11850 [Leifsonia xyli subsp. xyli]